MSSHASPKLGQVVMEALLRRRRLFVGMILVVVVLAVVVIAIVPKRYESRAKLLVKTTRTEAALSAVPAEVSPTELNSEAELLQSQGVARLVLGDHATESEIGALETQVTVQADPQTKQIDVTMEDATPWAASAQLRKMLKAYFDVRSVSVSTGMVGFFGTETDVRAQQLAEAQQKLTNFDVLHGIADSDLDEQKKLLVQQIATLEAQVSEARVSVAEQRSKTVAAKHELSLTPARFRTGESEGTVTNAGTNQASQERLGTELVGLVNRRTELLKQHSATDPQVVVVTDQIVATQKAIAAAASPSAAHAPAETSAVNPVYQQLSAAVASATGELSNLGAQAAALESELKRTKDKLTDLEQSTAAYDELKRNVTQAKAEYTLYMQRHDEAQGNEAVVKAKLFDVSVLQTPMASSVPVRPRPLVVLSASLLGGLLLAALLVWWAEAASGLVYRVSQVEALTGERVLAVIAEDDGAANRTEYRRLLAGIRDGLEEGKTGYCVALTWTKSDEGLSYLVRPLAREAARQRNSRVAIIDMAALLRKFEATGDAGFGMRFEEATEHWVLDLSQEAADGVVAPRGNDVQGVFATRMSLILTEMRKEFDLIFMDCPSLEESTLTGKIDDCVDGYVAVVAAGRSRKENIESMLARFERTHAPILGYVFQR